MMGGARASSAVDAAVQELKRVTRGWRQWRAGVTVCNISVAVLLENSVIESVLNAECRITLGSLWAHFGLHPDTRCVTEAGGVGG